MEFVKQFCIVLIPNRGAMRNLLLAGGGAKQIPRAKAGASE